MLAALGPIMDRCDAEEEAGNRCFVALITFLQLPGAARYTQEEVGARYLPLIMVKTAAFEGERRADSHAFRIWGACCSLSEWSDYILPFVPYVSCSSFPQFFVINAVLNREVIGVEIVLSILLIANSAVG